MDTKKVARFLFVLQLSVYLFSRNDLCQQVYRSLKYLYRNKKVKNMKYLRLFNNHEEYLEYIASEEFVRPSVQACKI